MHTPRDVTADLIVPRSGALDPVAAANAWFRLKWRQWLEDDTSAAITPDHPRGRDRRRPPPGPAPHRRRALDGEGAA